MKILGRYIFKRLLWMIPVILFVAIFVFTLMYFSPGDPARIVLSSNASEAEIQELRDEWGLNDSYTVQLGRFLRDVFLRFDLGESYMTGRSVSEQIFLRLPYTMLICYVSVAISVAIGILMGIASAVKQNTWIDSLISVAGMFGVSMPSFWFALVMAMYFAVKWRLLPTVSDGTIKGYLMAWISVAIGSIAMVSRQTRSSMLEVIRQDYITTARAKGESEIRVLFVHALKNAMLPVITTIGAMLGALAGASLIAETIFSIPGLGVYMMSGINQCDYPVVRGSVIVLSVIFSITMLIVDICYAIVDPRLREQFKK